MKKMFKYSFFITFIIILISCNSEKEKNYNTNEIIKVISEKTDSISTFKKYLLKDSTIVSEYVYPKSPINKFINGTFNIKYSKDTNNKWTYTASSNDSVFYKVESYCKNEDRIFLRSGKDIVHMEQFEKDSISNHKLYLINPYFFDSVTISTFSIIKDSLTYFTKDYQLKKHGFLIQNEDTLDLHLIINQYPKNCKHNFSDTVLLKNKRLLTQL